MKTLSKSMIIMCVLSAFLLVSPALNAEEKAGVKVGTLVITAVPGSGRNLIVRSSVDVEATFKDEAGKTEHYIGEMGIKLGLDLSFKTSEKLGYVVFSPSSDYRTGSYALQGKYFGTKASAAFGAGASAQLLIGGFDKSFTLQPLAVGYTTGGGVSAGLGYLYLQKDPSK